MPDPIILERLVSEVGKQIRLRRAEFYGLRGLFAGAVLALVPLVAARAARSAGARLRGRPAGRRDSSSEPCTDWPLKLPPGDVARLADRGYQLQDRVATSLEWGARPDRTPSWTRSSPTPRRASTPSPGGGSSRASCRASEAHPAPLVAGLLLSIAPPIPLPQGGLPTFSVSKEDEEDKPKERAGDMQSTDRPTRAKRDPIQRADLQERNMVPRAGAGGSEPARGPLGRVQGHVARVEGARLQLVPQERRRAHPHARAGGPSSRSAAGLYAAPDQGGVPARQGAARRARSEQEGVPGEAPRAAERDGAPRAQGRGQHWSGDVSEGMEALEGGQTDKAMDAMERALSKMRQLEDRGGTARA